MTEVEIAKGLEITDRSARREVRNPILALPSMAEVNALDASSRAAMRALLLDIQRDARERADKCWRTHKAPMAVYWKAVGVYAGHIARAVGPRTILQENSNGPA